MGFAWLRKQFWQIRIHWPLWKHKKPGHMGPGVNEGSTRGNAAFGETSELPEGLVQAALAEVFLAVFWVLAFLLLAAVLLALSAEPLTCLFSSRTSRLRWLTSLISS